MVIMLTITAIGGQVVTIWMLSGPKTYVYQNTVYALLFDMIV
jgi:hypothetical protein